MWITRTIDSRTSSADTAESAAVAAALRGLYPWLMAVLLLLAVTAFPVVAEQAGFPDGFTGIDHEVQALKQEVLEINRELLQLEEQLLYPADQQLLVFLSLSKDAALTLRHLRIDLDGETIVDHVYAAAEADALRRGGVHKPYVGRIDYGKHRLQAYVTAARSDGATFRQSSESSFAKGQGSRYVELRIAAPGSRRQPELTIHGWQQ